MDDPKLRVRKWRFTGRRASLPLAILRMHATGLIIFIGRRASLPLVAAGLIYCTLAIAKNKKILKNKNPKK